MFQVFTNRGQANDNLLTSEQLSVEPYVFCLGKYKDHSNKNRKKISDYKTRNTKQPVITLHCNLKSVGKNVRVHKDIWR